MSTNCVSFLDGIKFLMNNTSEVCGFIAAFCITALKTYCGMVLFSLEVLYNHKQYFDLIFGKMWHLNSCCGNLACVSKGSCNRVRES